MSFHKQESSPKYKGIKPFLFLPPLDNQISFSDGLLHPSWQLWSRLHSAPHCLRLHMWACKWWCLGIRPCVVQGSDWFLEINSPTLQSGQGYSQQSFRKILPCCDRMSQETQAQALMHDRCAKNRLCCSFSHHRLFFFLTSWLKTNVHLDPLWREGVFIKWGGENSISSQNNVVS